mgnify:CR=1 FL=1
MALIASLIGLLFGTFMAVISGVEKPIQDQFSLNGLWHGFTVSSALFGTILGSVIVGKPADLFGRKSVLMALAFLFTVASIGSALADSWLMFVSFRFMGGLAVGASSVLGPMYIAEIAPADLRGRLVMMYQFNIVLGILVALVLNYVIALVAGVHAWRWMLCVHTVPSLVLFFLLFIIPPTPRWLVFKGRHEEAGSILEKLGNAQPEKELELITWSLRNQGGKEEVSLRNPKYLTPIVFVVIIALFNQLSGIAAIMNYAPRIFEMAGFAAEMALMQALIIGAVNMVFTIMAIPLIDRFGRKKLLIWGAVGMVVFLGLVSANFYFAVTDNRFLVFYLVGFIAFFAFSQGAVVWVFISEIVPNKIRAKGQALGSFIHSTTSALLTWFFPMITETIPHGGAIIFAVFALFMLLQIGVVQKFLPETKGKTLEEIQQSLGID